MLKLFSLLTICFLLVLSAKFQFTDAAEGDFCRSISGITGVCGRLHRCGTLMNFYRQNGYGPDSRRIINLYETCSGAMMICCPDSTLLKPVQIQTTTIIPKKYQNTDAVDGDFCRSFSGIPGTCERIHRCVFAMKYFKQNGFGLASKSFINSYETCSGQNMICCPDSIPQKQPKITVPPLSNFLNSFNFDDVKIPQRTNFVKLASNLNLGLINKPMCGIATTERINFGFKTENKEYPFIALLGFVDSFNNLQWRCSGSLINDRYIITAAHCFGQLSKLKTVRLGEHTISTDKDCSIDNKICADPVQDIKVESYKIHENYNRKKFANDIALVRLASPANFRTNNVRPICLPTTDKAANQNLKNMLIAGWGQTENNRLSDDLLQAAVPFVPNAQCKQIFSRANKKVNLYDSVMCAGGVKSDTCYGDSGSPLIYFSQINGGSRIVQYGIVSSGVHCRYADKQQTFPSIFTDVRYYMDWILNNIKE